MTAGSKHFRRPRTASEPADVETSLADHELRSRAILSRTPGLGLFPRLAELASIGPRPFRAFTIDVLVAAPLGYGPSPVSSSRPARI